MDGDCATRREYHAEVVGTGPAGGKDVRVVLGTLETPYLGIMMRWLGTQANRIADGLNPDTDTSWLVKKRRALSVAHLPEEAPYVPAELRAWFADRERRQNAYDRLRDGWPFTLAAADHTGTYSLWVVPVDVPADASHDEPPIRTPEGPPTQVQRRRRPRPLLRWLPHREHAGAGHSS
ncbi:hypothetical protein AB0I84_08055 [Streptomyces spectabilis]|uniref:hypothetical protein n=1 Tax=Streptomyces spectabilis TaxID=68270 RepID=UPI0033E37686